MNIKKGTIRRAMAEAGIFILLLAMGYSAQTLLTLFSRREKV